MCYRIVTFLRIGLPLPGRPGRLGFDLPRLGVFPSDHEVPSVAVLEDTDFEFVVPPSLQGFSDFQALIDSKDRQVKRLGHDLMRPTRKLFELPGRYRDGTLSRAGWKRLMHPVRQEVDALLLRGAYSGNPRLVGMCNELYNHCAWLWTFLEVEGVQPQTPFSLLPRE